MEGGNANTNVFGLSSANSSSPCSGRSCMLVGVEAPVIGYSVMIIDMIVEGRELASFILSFPSSYAGKLLVFARESQSARGAGQGQARYAILYKQDITMLNSMPLGCPVACHHFWKSGPHDHWCRLYASLHLQLLV